MMKKGIILGALLLLSFNSYAELTVCNKYSCQSANIYDTKNILNALEQAFSGNQKELVLCEADPETKTCSNKPMTFLGRTNLVAVQFQIPFIRILQHHLENTSLQLVLDYQIQANQYYPLCSIANSKLAFSVSNQGDFILNTPPFQCRVTELGKTTMGMYFTFDYLNLDKGVIGATYQAHVKGDVLGGGTGYVLMMLSDLREIEMPRSVPTDFEASEGYQVNLDRAEEFHNKSPSESRLVDWDWDNIKEKWNNFKTKFMKILYLEPLDD